jgi:hypothetical protein
MWTTQTSRALAVRICTICGSLDHLGISLGQAFSPPPPFRLCVPLIYLVLGPVFPPVSYMASPHRIIPYTIGEADSILLLSPSPICLPFPDPRILSAVSFTLPSSCLVSDLQAIILNRLPSSSEQHPSSFPFSSHFPSCYTLEYICV